MFRKSLFQFAQKSMKVNPRVVSAEYAVRGLIPSRADEIKQELAKGGSQYPFDSLVYCNIGNPQSLQQPPLTFYRQVMSLIDAPFLLENEAVVASLPADAVARAKEYLSHIGTATGAYTGSMGYDFARQAVAAHINARDKNVAPPADPNDIFLTDGASNGVKVILQMLVGGPEDAVLVPIPQYPLYTAQIALLGGTVAPYYLEEEKGWTMDAEALEEALAAAAKEKGAGVRVLVVINPGNPTGGVMERPAMEAVIRFCHKHNILLLADEVYQENIYSDTKRFLSFREVALSMEGAISKEVVIASLHSTSKGIIGECGRRGGYLALTNFPADLRAQLVKLSSINLCANVNGQLMTALMCSPPAPGSASYESHKREYDTIFNSLKERAALLARELSTVVGFSCQPVEGAMYAFPQITLPEAYARHNEELNSKEGRQIALDARWALELLETTGIVVVPGSGFRQREGTLHFRTTILPPKAQMERMVKAIRAHQEGIYAKYK